jgi:hypothetical protein
MPETEEAKQYQLVQVPTGQALAIQTPEGDVMTTEQALVELLNKVDKIAKQVA